MLRQFLRTPLERIRSRAVKLMVRVMPSMDWVEGVLTDPDPRVRSNLLETLMKYAPVYTGSLRMMLKKASLDPHHRVKVTALYLMASRNDRQSRAVLEALLASGDELTVSAARWAIGKLDSAKQSGDAGA
jgi:HEAT repeat protein